MCFCLSLRVSLEVTGSAARVMNIRNILVRREVRPLFGYRGWLAVKGGFNNEKAFGWICLP